MLRRARAHLGPSAAVVACAGVALGFLPLFAGPGYESALGLGLILPYVVAVSTALRARRVRGLSSRVLLGLARGAVLGAVAFATTMLHGLRAGFCGLAAGSAFFALGPFAGALVAGTSAGILSHLALTLRWRTSLVVLAALSGPLVGVAVSALRFYASPVVFVFDPFVGFFSGMLYDTVIGADDRLLTYRAGSLATVSAVLVAAHGWDRRRPAALFLALVPAAASATLLARAPTLGHAGTASSIAEALGGRVEGRSCTVIYARTLRASDVALFVRDCDTEVQSVAAWLGVETPRVTAYLFATGEQKRLLMGARDVYVAKPWRREVYVQFLGYPHPVLRHELAHVVAGEVGRGPFRVAGRLAGLVPNPGLIEGLAVAAAPEDDALSPAEWSAAMLELGLLPPASSLFSLGFLGHDASRAYTAAGAFVSFVRERHGALALQRWYHGERLEEATGESLGALDEAFRRGLAGLRLPEIARPLARARFGRPAVFARRCPHEVDRYRRRAEDALARGDATGAMADVDAALRLAPRDSGLLLLRAGCAERAGAGDAMARFEALADDTSQPVSVRLRAAERRADRALASDRTEEAARGYREIRAQVLDEDHARALDVKLAASIRPALRPAVVALLIGSADRGPDPSLALELLGREAREEPIAAFLLAKNAASRGDHAHAAEVLDEVTLTGVPDTVLREAARLRVAAGCAAADRAGIGRGLTALRAAPPGSGNRRVLTEELAARCLTDAAP